MNVVCRRHVRRPRVAAFGAVLAAALAFGASLPVRAQVLQQVPSDALVVVKVSNLKAVSDKVAKFAEALGLAAVQPEFADPLASMQQNLQIKEGVDTAGEMAFVMTRPANEDVDEDELLMILVPVSDYKAFLGNFADAKTEGEVTTFTPGGEQEKHVANWGKYAAIVQNKALLAKKPGGLKLAGLAAKEAREKDAFIFANIPALSVMAMPHLKEARKEGIAEIERELAGDEQAKQFAPVVRAGMNQLLNIAEGFMRDATAAGMSLHLNDQGLQTTVMAEFKPDSYGGKMAAQFKNTDQPLMAGLPEGREYFAAGGMINAPEVTGKLLADLLDPISKELAATPSGKSFAPAVDSIKKAAAATKSVAFGYPAPTGEVGQDSVVQSIMVMRGDAKAIAASQKNILQATQDLMKMMPAEAGGQMKFEITPGGKTVGDLKLDTYKTEMAMDPNNPQAAQAQAIMSMIYGEHGMTGVYGPVNNEAFVLVQGGTDETIQKAVTAARNPKDTMTGMAGIKTVSGQLPAQRIVAEYIFLDNIVSTGVRYAQANGLPFKMKLPDDLPPIGITGATEGSAVRFDGFVPTKLIQSLVAAGMESYMQMQGGGGAAPAAPGEGL